jgi:hypothetical protein
VFLEMRCECGLTRREHSAVVLADDHAFTPVDEWAKCREHGGIGRVDARVRGQKGVI